MLFSIVTTAQQIKGRVLNELTNDPLNGVTIVLKENNSSTITDIEGNFTINGVIGNKLQLSSAGFVTITRTIDSIFLTIKLVAETKELGEVVVTALGIKREKKKLGYAIQEIKGEDLTIARETNVVNQLAGKVAGVTVIGSPSGVGGSSRVTIRGERSVDLNKN